LPSHRSHKENRNLEIPNHKPPEKYCTPHELKKKENMENPKCAIPKLHPDRRVTSVALELIQASA
jgi:hypothetical protein